MSEIRGSRSIREVIKGLSELYDRSLSPYAAEIFERALDGYPKDEVLRALTKCMKELTRFPTVAEVISRIDDGHPGVEEAWAMIPKNEYDSAVWTDEMREAYFSGVNMLVEEDVIAARMAFKEKYSKLLADARLRRKKARWEITLGNDIQKRKSVAIDAISKGLLNISDLTFLVEDKRDAQILSLATKAIDHKSTDTVSHQNFTVDGDKVRGQLDEFIRNKRKNGTTNS